MARIHLVDASPYIFRAFFSLPDSITSSDGSPMNAVYGFSSFLLAWAREERATHAAILFDGSLTTSFRNELFPDYKKQRELPPPELEQQLDACREAADALGFATWIDDRYEADDLIATIIHRLPDEDFIIVTSDKDLAQLVDERVELHDYARNERYGPEKVDQKFGVKPSQIPDYLGLAGDSVDNIPGVKGVGPKSARVLLEEFGDLDGIYARLDDVERLQIRGAASLRRKLEREEEIARLSRGLARLSTDASLSVTTRELAWSGPRDHAIELFEKWQFDRIAQTVRELCER